MITVTKTIAKKYNLTNINTTVSNKNKEGQFTIITLFTTLRA